MNNLSNITNFPNGITSWGVPVFGNGSVPGNVYIVADTTSLAYQQLAAKYGNQVYEDGSQMLYPHTSTASTVTTNGLKNALAATVADRNDYVIVMPSTNTYYVDDDLTISKKSTHFIAPAGLVYDVGSNNSVRIQQITDAKYIINITGGGIEVAGFYMKNYDGHAHIHIPNGNSAWGLSIHHNLFVGRSTSSSEAMLWAEGDAASYSRIEKNWFQEQVSSATYAACISIGNTAANTDCVGNYITIGDSCTATVGILNLSVKSVIANNYFSECGGNGAGVTGGTITKCISMGATCAAIGNRASVGTGQILTGGTTAHSYSDNIGGVTGDAGQATQLEA